MPPLHPMQGGQGKEHPLHRAPLPTLGMPAVPWAYHWRLAALHWESPWGGVPHQSMLILVGGNA